MVKSVGRKRVVKIPLTESMIRLLRALPTFATHRLDDYIFQNSAGGKLGNWDRITRIIQEVSKTEEWHRHDLRRSAATLARAIGCDTVAIDAGLRHANPLAKTDASGSARAYMVTKRKFHHIPDPVLVMFEKLGEALDAVEQEFGRDYSGNTREERLRAKKAERKLLPSSPSP